MKAIYYEDFKGPVQVRMVPIPVIAEGSVLLKVQATGLCRSDWHGYAGHDSEIKLPHVPGHEFAGTIVQMGRSVESWNIGDRVTAPFVQACGRCRYCGKGDQQVCLSQEQAGFTHWGSFAQFVEVKNAEVNLVRVPDTLSLEHAAILGCRFGTAYRALRVQLQIRNRDKILICGAGGVGLSALIIAKAMGVGVGIVDPSEKARQLAIKQGADEVFAVLNHKTVQKVVTWSNGGVDAFVDAFGDPFALEHGLGTLRRRGKYIQVGLIPDTVGKPQTSFEKLVAHELEIIGSHGIQAHEYQALLDFVQEKIIDFEPLIKGFVTLEKGAELLQKDDGPDSAGIVIIVPWMSEEDK